jgi:hypothetical protein
MNHTNSSARSMIPMFHLRGPVAGREAMALPTSFNMSFAPTQQLVTVVRRFVKSLYEQILHDRVASGQLALATHELLENAIKYTIDAETTLWVSLLPLEDTVSDATVMIRTRNRATPENIVTAQRIIATVRDAEDPYRFYQELILESAEVPDVSGLGLARIRAETPMTIDFQVHGDEIEIVAQARIRLGGAQ